MARKFYQILIWKNRGDRINANYPHKKIMTYTDKGIDYVRDYAQQLKKHFKYEGRVIVDAVRREVGFQRLKETIENVNKF